MDPRPPPLRLPRRPGHLPPHPPLEEQHVVQEIFRLYATTRQGTRGLADHLNAHGRRTKNGKPWSGHTIGRMLANRLYLGEVGFRDVTVPHAHPPLVDPDLFDQCQAILQARGEAGSSRAASNSDYLITGQITCPRCGHKYIGASATGKLRRYRYYTCYSRVRYGRAGCPAIRIDADRLNTAVAEALVDFYARTDLITAAGEAEPALRAESALQQTGELAAITAEVQKTQAAIDRYLTAFENGTLDERTCGHRVRDLTARLHQLHARRGDLADLTGDGPQPPSPQAIRQLRDHLADVLGQGTPGQRKAVIETHVAEIKIEGNRLIPTFRVPSTMGGPARRPTPPLQHFAHRRG